MGGLGSGGAWGWEQEALWGGQRKKVVGEMTGMGTGHFGSEVET